MGKGSLVEKQNRLSRIIGLLRRDEMWTTKSLCSKLEVSSRTLMRDLAELRESGYPIESDRGRGGGIRLSGRWGIDKLSLSSFEAINMMMSLAIVESLNSPLLGNGLKSIRQKITQSFGYEQRSQINQLRKRIYFGKKASDIILDNYKKPKESILEPLTTAFFTQNKIEITYLSDKKEKTKRIIESQLIVLNWPVWYVMGFDELRQDMRMFRVDRIQSLKKLNEKFSLINPKLVFKGFEKYFETL